ncbi:MAG TPA: hypothetical protein VD866_01405 [Urbifossiella sp.]|nr:hypothetical protein [Urbifossiella sp.]
MVTAGGQLHSEEFGQDAVGRPPGYPTRGAAAIQFKHSAVPGREIERAELLDILVAFDRSRAAAAASRETIDQFFLVTNRQLAADAQTVLDHARREATPHRSLRLPAPDSAKSTAATVARLALYQGNPGAAAAAWHTTLQNLEVHAGVAHEWNLKQLRAFAARYGVLDGEWGDQVTMLVGAFVTGATDDTPIAVTRDWLKEHLVGDPGAANLDFSSRTQPHLTTICRERLEWEREHHLVPADRYLERQAHAELQAALDVCPVVFVSGDGGCGKSLAVERYLETVADRQLVWREWATGASETAIVAGLLTARMPGRRAGGLDRTLADVRARLDHANPGRRPLWTIDLDGVDEAPEQRSDLQHLIRLCWANGNPAASPAALVVTCRASTGTRARDDLIARWLGIADPELAQNVGLITVGQFLDHELLEAARLINGRPERRIVWTLARPESATAGSRVAHTTLVPSDILRTLRHPVVWGSYASLHEPDRDGILDGNPVHLGNLARRLLTRFLGRCHLRKWWSDDLMVERALLQLARAVTGPPPHSLDAWTQGCAPCLGLTEAHNLYHECLSYGIIERDASLGWRWCHQFLVAHLAACEGGDTHE